MRVDRRHFILTALAAASTACRRDASGSDDSLEAAVRYLWSQQADDGGFHSQTYGLLASGQSLTPFVLNALIAVPESVAPRPRRGVENAIGFIIDHTSGGGILGLHDPASPDYPNYATALAVRALIRTGHESVAAPSMVAALRGQQFAEDNGWHETDAPYGGWGMGGPIRRPPQAGHVDLSMTRCVLEALAAAGAGRQDPAFERARVYVSRSQNPDGGFFFSTVNSETNKAGSGEDGYASYGTATADGVLALRALGVVETDDALAGAKDWLEARHEPARAPGLDSAPYGGWDEGLRFYYAGTIARAMPHLGVTLPPSEPDGSFSNPSNLVKEDDPLIATAFAVEAFLAERQRH